MTRDPANPHAAARAERILVCVATYKERDNLQPLTEAVHVAVPRADILVIDDNSPDGTGELADRLAAADPRVKVLHRAGKLGLGTAILAGMRYALQHDYDLLVTMDADFSHDPRYLPALLAGMGGRDVMIGSRYIPGGGVRNWPVSRQLMSWGVNTLVRLLMRIPARDTSGNYRCYRVAGLRVAALDGLLSHGYSFQEEVLYRCHRAGLRLGETPIIFEDRRAGASKVDPREAVHSMAVILHLGLRAMFGLE
ncbi:MAG: polyprenol monophosphomannose synthase [Gemmataceae bacterium]|nr:polyprenol monophosphomannose synthase [Gemmataceae bacterium]